MIGVPYDTREPAVIHTRTGYRSWRWGLALVLTGLIWCAIPPEAMRSSALAEPADGPAAPRFRDPKRPTLDDENAEPWEVITNPQQGETEEPIVKIQVEGNITIPDATILQKIKTRRGRPATAKGVNADVRALFETRWFLEVTPIYRKTEEGIVLVFRVAERPILENVTYVGNKKIKTRYLEGVTGLRKGGAFSVSANLDAARGIERYYEEKGYHFAKVTVEKGKSEDDREVVFRIEEGPKTVVVSREFEGNSFFSASLLATKLKTTVRILPYVGGKYNPTDLEDDVAALREYYNKLGFFDVKISGKPEFTADKAKVTMRYTIAEGIRYKVGKIQVQGNQILSTSTLAKDFTLAEDEYFNADKLNRDVDGMTEKYGELGRLFAEVNATPRFREQPGMVDVIYRIDEDRVYRIRRIDPIINGGSGSTSHTKDTVVLNSMFVAPGDLANKKLINKSERRIKGIGIFDGNTLAGTAPKIAIRRVEDMNSRPTQVASSRAQAFDEDESPVQSDVQVSDPAFPVPIFPRKSAPKPATEETPEDLSDLQSKLNTRETLRRLFNEPLEAQHDPEAAAAEEEMIIRAQGPGLEGPPAQNPLFNNSPQGNPYGNPNLNPSPDQPGWVDLVPEVTETQTGRISFGVGINSDAGFLGNAIVDESNFDILRVPTSFRDILNGTAFRGGGQQFRLEAVPGNQVSRYLISWRDPFFLDTNYSLGVSGFYYTRVFQYWNETRSGGKVTLGRQFDNFLSGQFSLRLEDVDVYNPPHNPPALLTQALGHSLLSTARVGLIHDTRDSAFLPTEGHYLEGAYEQAFGDFSYPRVDLTARQYFTMYQRADGEGRHILALNGQLSYTGNDTPIYERLFAGGFSSFRGFQFRGVSPVENGVGVGGQWLALGSAEYIFPITASENVRGVVFSDFGTVENDVSFHDFRATAGVGLRVTIPAMGPLPIALDLGFPIARQDTDLTRMFSFYVGFLR